MINSILKRRSLRGGAALQAIALLGAGLTGGAVFATSASAQDVTSGSMSGTVVDQAGNPVGGATVTVTSTGRGFQRSVTTSAGGVFNITQLPIGTYDAEVSGPNVATTRVEGLQARLGGASFTLTVGEAGADSAGSDIVVTGRVERSVDFSGTATGQVFNVQEIAKQIPVARDIASIQLLAPQATSGDSAFGGVSLGGSSVAENISYINGMNVTNFRTFVGGTTIPFEFYDQVQVKTGGYQAEFGRNTGGAVIALSRSGSNEFRGGANVFWEMDSLRSDSPNTFSANNSRDERERVDGNIWASGPIIKDRLFFFGFFNPRYRRTFDVAQSEKFNAAGTTSLGFSDDTSTGTVQKTPFYGGKLDLNLFDGHRVEATYFNDTSSTLNTITTLSDGSSSSATDFRGGSNYIFKYTGAFTNWLTFSALYGRSNFNQTSAGSDDAIPYVLDGRSGTLVYVAGNPLGTIDTGRDRRTNYRGDLDLNFNLLGQHTLRLGGDYEKLTATADTIYSGGVYYRYYRTGAGGATVNGVAVAGNTDYVRLRSYTSGGTFNVENTAFYAQDSWDVTPRLNLNLGVRYDKFVNFGATGEAFTKLDNQFAPRVGFSYDVLGDRRTKLSGFYGRYYLPVAANTNIRLAGTELFYEEFYNLGAGGSLVNPALGGQIGARNTLSDSSGADPSTLVSQNLKPQYLDEFLASAEHRFGGFRVKLSGVYRKLGAVLEDTDLRYSISAFCKTQNLVGCNATNAPTGLNAGTAATFVAGAPAGTFLPSINGATIGSGGYVLFNPGSDIVVNVDLQNNGTLTTLNIPAAATGIPKARRVYKALELEFEREFDGVWGLQGSYVLSEGRGNYEGGVKSDNGQADTGLTQDFDEPGWVDGADGLLPNHRAHTFKLYGSYKPVKEITLGFNGFLQSPRRFGCYGTYPFTDGRASLSTASSWYCSNPLATGLPLAAGSVATARDPGFTAPVLIGRGNAFKSQWNKQIDLSLQFTPTLPNLRGVTLRADVFNVFNWSSGIDYVEAGDLENRTQSNRNYGKVNGYQAPRIVRLGLSLDF